MKRSNFDTLKAWKERSQKRYQEGRRGNVVRAQDARGPEEPRDSVVQISDYLQAEQAPEEITSARIRRQARTVKPRQKPQDSPQRARKREADSYYRQQRDMRLVRAGGRCEVLINPDMPTSRCPRVATQTHHKKRRSHQVDHDVENLLATCATCHSQIHANVEWARARGYIVTEWQQIDSNDS